MNASICLGLRTHLLDKDDVNREKDELWDRINKRLEKLESDSSKTHDNLLLYLVALLYTDLPPRRNMDFQAMRIDVESERGNTFDGDYFSFRRFKSVQRDKHQHFLITDLPPRLHACLEMYLQRHPCLPMTKGDSCYFLVDSIGRGFTKINSMTRLLERAIGVSSQTLRERWFSKFT
jgi:hypothetical protein